MPTASIRCMLNESCHGDATGTATIRSLRSLKAAKTSTLQLSDQGFWRREGDSNPRNPCGFNGFQDRRNRPLCHLSVDEVSCEIVVADVLSAGKIGPSPTTWTGWPTRLKKLTSPCPGRSMRRLRVWRMSGTRPGTVRPTAPGRRPCADLHIGGGSATPDLAPERWRLGRRR